MAEIQRHYEKRCSFQSAPAENLVFTTNYRIQSQMFACISERDFKLFYAEELFILAIFRQVEKTFEGTSKSYHR